MASSFHIHICPLTVKDRGVNPSIVKGVAKLADAAGILLCLRMEAVHGVSHKASSVFLSFSVSSSPFFPL